MGTVVDFDELLLTSRLHDLSDADVIWVLLVLLADGEDGIIHAARSDRLQKLARSALREAGERWFPLEATAEAFRRLELIGRTAPT